MKDLLIDILENIGFAEVYTSVCNAYSNYDEGENFKKADVLKILEELESNLDYASREKVFYQDYSISDLSIRFSFTYKFGFIECFYAISSTESEDRIRGRFNTIATLERANFREQVKHNFPIATTLNELRSILRGLLELNDKFIVEVRNQKNTDIVPLS